MPFNKDISGYQNENEIIMAFNNKKVYQLYPQLQEFLYDIFESINPNDLVKVIPNYNRQKADMIIIINGIQKRISIKKGIKNSVHVESVDNFITFLRQNNVPKEIIDAILRYHYADGTIDGSGNIRLSSSEYKELHQDEIDKINSFLNKDEILRKAIKRFVLIGNQDNKEIDAIMYGVIDDFIWIKKADIIKILLKRKNIKATGIHFGSLFYQPLNRCINKNPKYESARNRIQIKWYHLSDDIIESMNDNWS